MKATKAKARQKYLIIRVDPEMHSALKVTAARNGMSIQRLVEQLIDDNFTLTDGELTRRSRPRVHVPGRP